PGHWHPGVVLPEWATHHVFRERPAGEADRRRPDAVLVPGGMYGTRRALRRNHGRCARATGTSAARPQVRHDSGGRVQIRLDPGPPAHATSAATVPIAVRQRRVDLAAHFQPLL